MVVDEAGSNPSDVLVTYVLERFHWKKRKEFSGKVQDATGKTIFHVKGATIIDDTGVTMMEAKPAHTGALHPDDLNVFDSSGQYIGSIIKTRHREKGGWIVKGKPAQWSLMNAYNQVVAIAEPTDTQRLLPSYEIPGIDGRAFVKVYPTGSEDFYQADILQPTLHPLVVLYYLATRGNPLAIAAN